MRLRCWRTIWIVSTVSWIYLSSTVVRNHSLLFLPRFSLHTKKWTDFFNSRKRVSIPRSETRCRTFLSSVTPSKRSLIYYLSLHLPTMECSLSVHTRIDTLARLLPFFRNCQWEDIPQGSHSILTSKWNMKLRYYPPITNDFIKILFDKDNTVENYIENANVSAVLSVWSNTRNRCRGGSAFFYALLDLCMINA